MTQALLLGNFEAAVEMCLADNKMAEAILLAIAGGQDLLLRTQKKYFQRNKSNLGRVSSAEIVKVLLLFLSSKLCDSIDFVVSAFWIQVQLFCSLNVWACDQH